MTLSSGGNLDITGEVRGRVLRSDVANGTAPLIVSSTTKVNNLNADLLDGLSSGSFLRSDASDTATGTLTVRDILIQSGYTLQRSSHQSGHLEGGHNNLGSTSTKTSPIYTIGSSYNPNESTLGNMYGLGFSHTSASFINFTGASGWGAYVASDGDARIFLCAENGVISSTGNHYVGSNRVLHTGDEGSGNGIDADTVDGIQGASFLRSDANDTATGTLTVRDIKISSGYHLQRSNHHSGHLEGSYNNVGANSYKSNPIYSIGSSYNPADASLATSMVLDTLTLMLPSYHLLEQVVGVCTLPLMVMLEFSSVVQMVLLVLLEIIMLVVTKYFILVMKDLEMALMLILLMVYISILEEIIKQIDS